MNGVRGRTGGLLPRCGLLGILSFLGSSPNILAANTDKDPAFLYIASPDIQTSESLQEDGANKRGVQES